MTPSELKAAVESRGTESHFFDWKSMRFFGDTMKNYGVRAAAIRAHYDAAGNYCEGGTVREVWELYRKRPVKHGLSASAYFDCVTFERVFSWRWPPLQNMTG